MRLIFDETRLERQQISSKLKQIWTDKGSNKKNALNFIVFLRNNFFFILHRHRVSFPVDFFHLMPLNGEDGSVKSVDRFARWKFHQTIITLTGNYLFENVRIGNKKLYIPRKMSKVQTSVDECNLLLWFVVVLFFVFFILARFMWNESSQTSLCWFGSGRKMWWNVTKIYSPQNELTFQASQRF